jgi:hypothetical protein
MVSKSSMLLSKLLLSVTPQSVCFVRLQEKKIPPAIEQNKNMQEWK